jgi:hypothetical protein
MTIYNIYMFDRNGLCLYHQDWQRKKQSNLPLDEEYKLMYGMLFSMKSFITRMSPTDSKDTLVSYQTNNCKLNFMETPAGLKIVLNTDLAAKNVEECLQNIYKLYVDYVVKNPLTQFGEPIENELFVSRLNGYITKLPIYY